MLQANPPPPAPFPEISKSMMKSNTLPIGVREKHMFQNPGALWIIKLPSKEKGLALQKKLSSGSQI